MGTSFRDLLLEKKLTLSQVEGAIANKEDFIGPNSKGYTDTTLGYVVKSYDTIIYSDKDGLNTKKYSSTTSKLQNIIMSALGIS